MIYSHELKIHNNDELEVLVCLQNTFGFSQDAADLLTYKESPTFKTKVACFLSSLVFNYSMLMRAFIPLFKTIALAFDLIRDYIMLYRMVQLISGSMRSEPDDVIPQDFILVSNYCIYISLAHILSAFYAYSNRQSIFRTCEHEQSERLSWMLSVACLVFFPFLGAFMAITNEIQTLELEKQFQCIKSTDWSRKVVTKGEFEDLMTKSVHHTQSSMKGFITFKILESSLESFYQVSFTLFLICQDPFDGTLNQSFLGFGAHENERNKINSHRNVICRSQNHC